MNSPDAESAPAPEPSATRQLDFAVVGLGASAGGVAALLRFFEHMPSNTGMAFVVILHLSPKHKSNADHVLQAVTRMPVQQVTARTAIKPDHVYVIPPTFRLIVEDGHLDLAETPKNGARHHAIDDFLRTLAHAQREAGIAIILSGTGGDGSVGIKSIKEHGGIILAQSPDDAEFESMPRNAIGTGLVDFVLPVAEMPRKLAQVWANAKSIQLPFSQAPEREGDGVRAADADGALLEILATLRTRTGHDFSQYKRATVLRRIERRLQVTQLQDLTTYLAFLRDHLEETRLLLGDMLIGVTNFFRDRAAFAALERVVVPQIFSGKERMDSVRVWVPACSTGEEAYSIAMLLAEHAAGIPDPPQIQLFATDIDENAIAVARIGRYPEAIAVDVAPERLRRFFSKNGGGYLVHRSIRDTITFAVHNLLKDPPFSRLDLVSCRNFLIYLNRDAQARALDTLEFALLPDGYLMLGTSESMEEDSHSLAAVDKQNRIFRRGPHRRAGAKVPPLLARLTPAPADARVVSAKTPTPRELHQAILELYAPPSLVVDERGDIIHSSENAHRFLQFAGGEPSRNLMKVVQPELRTQLRSALYQAMHTMQPTEAKGIGFVRNRGAPWLDVRIHPLVDDARSRRFALVVFDEHPAPAPSVAPAESEDTAAAALEIQLDATRRQLHATVEQYETRNEELTASNEELSAINEELRSTTEELETSREELQSINEELRTVNQELKNSVEETKSVNSDLQNLMAATEIAVVIVDTALCLRRYTPAAGKIFNVIPSDVGRPLFDLRHRLDYPGLGDDVQRVIATLKMHDTVAQSNSDDWFAVRILPYRTIEDQIRGAVLTFVDITESRRLAREMARYEGYLLRVLEGIEDYVVFALDNDGRITSWNKGATRILGYTHEEAVGQPWELLFTPAEREAGVPEQELRAARDSGRSGDERWYRHKDGSRVFLGGVVSAIEAEGLLGYVKIARDLTARFRLEERQQQVIDAEQELRKLSDEQTRLKQEFLATMSHEMRNPLNAILLQTELVLGMPRQAASEEAVRKAVLAIRQLASTQGRLIDDLLDVARERTGKLELRSQLLPLPFIIGDAVGALAPEAIQKNIVVVTDLPETPVIVAADPVRVRQIAWNLVSNALKFTPEGGQITVRVAQENDQARLDVEDTGEGIAADILPYVFDLFRQGDSSMRRKHGGLGIGLALSKQLVELHGGRIRAASEGPGKGARFTVWLPVQASQRLEAAPGDEREDRGGKASRALAGVRVVVVDDAPDTSVIMEELLRRQGAEARSFSSAREALAACQSERPDIVISDLAMPGMDGMQFIAALRSAPGNGSTPVIFTSGYSRPDDVTRARAAGAADYLVKPVRLEALVGAVLRAIRQAPSR